MYPLNAFGEKFNRTENYGEYQRQISVLSYVVLIGNWIEWNRSQRTDGTDTSRFLIKKSKSSIVDFCIREEPYSPESGNSDLVHNILEAISKAKAIERNNINILASSKKLT